MRRLARRLRHSRPIEGIKGSIRFWKSRPGIIRRRLASVFRRLASVFSPLPAPPLVVPPGGLVMAGPPCRPEGCHQPPCPSNGCWCNNAISHPLPRGRYPLPGNDNCLPFPETSPVYALNLTLPTLLTNHSLHVQIARFKHTIPIPGPHKPENYVTRFLANGQRVALPDLVGRNGAIHIIDRVLNPRGPRPPHPHEEKWVEWVNTPDEWEGWEEWLPKWALES